MSWPKPATIGPAPAPAVIATEPSGAAGRVPPSFVELCDRHMDFVARTLRRMGVPGADVDDAVQNVFLVAYDRLRDIQPGKERSFLIGISLRVASHDRRSRHRRDRATSELAWEPELTPPPNPEQAAQVAQARLLLDRVLDAMPEPVRLVFALFELEQMSLDDIAATLEIPRGTVASRLRRSREIFHEETGRLRPVQGDRR